MVTNVLLNKYHSQNKKLLLKYFTSEEQKSLIDKEIDSVQLDAILDYPYALLKRMHSSWIHVAIKKLPSQLQSMAIAALPKEQREKFKVEIKTVPCFSAKQYYLKMLSDLLHIDDHCPDRFLPHHELTPLLHCNKSQLTELIDFLGLYDLASTVRQIVNRTHLNVIYQSLSKRELAFLKICLREKERITSPKLNIDLMASDRDKIRAVIHRRGLTRLVKAMNSLQADFVWVIAHLLDRGRGEIILKEYRPHVETKVTEILKQQVVAVMNFLQASKM